MRFISMIAAMLGFIPAWAAPTVTPADSAVLESVLRERYPDIDRWDVILSDTFHAKRGFDRFAEAEGVSIQRDGNLFSIRSSGSSLARKYRVAGYRNVLAARSLLQRGSALSAQDLTRMEYDVFGMACDALPASFELRDFRLRRNLRRNEVICRADVEPRPLVVKHDSIDVKCVQGSVAVAVQGRALRDGDLGQRITVRRPGMPGKLNARVTGKGTANACV